MENWRFIAIEKCDSTNNLIKQLRKKGEIDNRSVIMAGFQENGRGQGKNAWHSEAFQNLLCSIYLKTQLDVDKHFFLNIVVSLAIHDLLSEYSIDSRIKWPNDIYVDNSKIAGILIENSLLNKQIVETVIGVGLNINQLYFPDWIPNPVSISKHTGKTHEINSVLERLTALLEKYYSDLVNGLDAELFHNYTNLLYKLNTWSIFESNGHTFNGQIHGIMPDGRLLLETEGGQIKHFLFGEVKYVR